MRSFLNRISVAASLAYRTLKKHKIMSVMLAVQCFLSLYLIGVILQQEVFKSNTSKPQASETFSLIQNLDGALYYGYYGEKNEIYKNLIQFYDKLNSCDDITHHSFTNTGIDICNDNIPQGLLQNHDMFEYDEEALNQSRRYDDNGVLISSVDCKLISANLLDDDDIYSGRRWLESDLDWNAGDEVPVILGYSFLNTYSIGDVFDAQYSLEPVKCRVIGFLKQDAVFEITKIDDGFGYEEFKYNESLLFPAIKVKPEGINGFGRAVVLDRIGGYVTSKLGYEKTSTLINTLLGECGIATGGSGIYLQSNSTTDVNANIYNYMTEHVKQQFYLLLCCLMVFVIFSVTFTLNGFLRENYYSYGIMLLCGGSSFDISLSIVVICLTIVGAGYLTALYILVLSGISLMIFAAISVISLATVTVTCIVPLKHISKYDISHIIGGKE